PLQGYSLDEPDAGNPEIRTSGSVKGASGDRRLYSTSNSTVCHRYSHRASESRGLPTMGTRLPMWMRPRSPRRTRDPSLAHYVRKVVPPPYARVSAPHSFSVLSAPVSR